MPTSPALTLLEVRYPTNNGIRKPEVIPKALANPCKIPNKKKLKIVLNKKYDRKFSVALIY